MNSLFKLITKSKGKGTFFLTGTIISIVLIALVILTASSLLLIWGINLLGFPVEYTWKTILGGLIIMSVLKAPGTNTNN